jgi:uncharacterized protein (DUF1015 family)
VIRSSVPIDKKAILSGLEKYFTVSSVARSVIENISKGEETSGIGLAFSETECYLLKLKDEKAAYQSMPAGKPLAWYQLDVARVSYLILEPLMGINSSNLEKSVLYTPRSAEAFDRLKDASASCVIFLRPLAPIAIKEICEAGELMPQKSTYFYPKFPSGLVMYRH